jgi:nucleoside-diphosphate-sugar epimerase
MKVIVTGGGGFVGRNVARCLRKLGHDVVAPTHQELDMTDLTKCMTYFHANNVEAVVHTAFKGHFSSQNQHQDFVENIKMYEVLTWLDDYRPTIIIGSGAEFDRRFDIDQAEEDSVFNSWPVDLYGLSKNIISKRALGLAQYNEDEQEIHDPYVLRLFGCFGSDEPDFRFIKRSILRLKQGLPIEVLKNKDMDFFFVDDVATVIDKVITTRSNNLRHLNLVYQNDFNRKETLAGVGMMICKAMNVPVNVVVKDHDKDNRYTGNGWRLRQEKLPLIGLENGIKRMVEELA